MGVLELTFHIFFIVTTLPNHRRKATLLSRVSLPTQLTYHHPMDIVTAAESRRSAEVPGAVVIPPKDASFEALDVIEAPEIRAKTRLYAILCALYVCRLLRFKSLIKDSWLTAVCSSHFS